MRKLSHDSIQAMALKAAEQYDDVNDACPYPFGTADGQLFKRIFCEAKEKAKQKQPLALVNPTQAATQTRPDQDR